MAGDQNDPIRLTIKDRPGFKTKRERIEEQKIRAKNSKFPYAVTAVLSFFVGGIFVLLLNPLGGGNPTLTNFFMKITNSANDITGQLQKEEVTYFDFDIDIYYSEDGSVKEDDKLLFSGKMPSNSILRETKYEYGKYALFESNEFILKFSPVIQKNTIQLENPVDVIAEYFGDLARSTFNTTDKNYYYTSKDIEFKSFGRCNTNESLTTPAPCGSDVIKDPVDLAYFQAECEAETKAGLNECDKIITSLIRDDLDENLVGGEFSQQQELEEKPSDVTATLSPDATDSDELSTEILSLTQDELGLIYKISVTNDLLEQIPELDSENNILQIEFEETVLTIQPIVTAELKQYQDLEISESNSFPFPIYFYQSDENKIQYISEPSDETCVNSSGELLPPCGLNGIFSKEEDFYIGLECLSDDSDKCEDILKQLTVSVSSE